MRHRRKAKYFGVKTAHRKAMFRNMVTSLFRHGRITTTVPRAKELRRLADRLVSLGKDGSLHARRQALSIIMDKAVVAKLFSDIADQMASRNGGYTRIVRIGPRRGDGAMMCMIELVKESLRYGKPKTARSKEEAAPTVIPQAKEAPPEEVVEETESVREVEEAEESAPADEVSASEESLEEETETPAAEGEASALEEGPDVSEKPEEERSSAGSEEPAENKASEEENAGQPAAAEAEVQEASEEREGEAEKKD